MLPPFFPFILLVTEKVFSIESPALGGSLIKFGEFDCWLICVSGEVRKEESSVHPTKTSAKSNSVVNVILILLPDIMNT
jgi:hypothetical protein